ncbi:hypothetical protein [Mesorhizobium sp.]|uniref:hypothetical protein n=1 Tax=Mesorhizobium sp. TaxID=1871066 RepID=UPI001223F8A6|nr:hypothetical protein [Mesorhizobium sp.]TIQ11016.1 MAG: hypothetical protein E5X50_09510 [Mesorhizobium sp.]
MTDGVYRPPNWREGTKATFLKDFSNAYPPDENLLPNETLALVARLIAVLDRLPADADEQKKFARASFGMNIAQHVAMEFEKIFLKPLVWDVFKDERIADSRMALLAMLMYTQSSILPQARSESDIVFVPLPGSYVSFLIEQLKALDHGEQDTIFQPARTGKHSDRPYEWAKAREEAVLHVAYMQGTGRTKTSSRELIGGRIGVAVNTLRDWEREIHESDLADAREAGRLEDRRINLGEPWPKAVDASVLAMADRLSGKLHEFASWYRGEYGKSHWGAGN